MYSTICPKFVVLLVGAIAFAIQTGKSTGEQLGLLLADYEHQSSFQLGESKP